MKKSRHVKVFGATLLLLLAAPSGAIAACGAGFQRMEVGVLPDIFLNHIMQLEAPQLRLPGGRGPGNIPGIENLPGIDLPRGPGLSIRSKDETVKYHWTANREVPPKGDCNVMARVTIPYVGVYDSYGGCDLAAGLCAINWSPNASTVGPAIDDFAVKEWLLRVIAHDEARERSIGAVELFIVDSQGDISQPPPCLRADPQEGQTPGSEFYVPRPFVEFDPNDPCWDGDDRGGSPAYLIGRGNLYVGPLDQPAFRVTAGSDQVAVPIDHWIADRNAVIFVTPKAPQTGSTKFFGLRFDERARKWTIVAERDGAIIPAGSKFNIYVMGHRGPGFRLNSLVSGTHIELEHPLLDANPNAVVFINHVVSERCVERIDSGHLENLPGIRLDPRGGGGSRWACALDFFDHPLGVRYDGSSKRWQIVSEDGTQFPEGGSLFNVYVSGLAGKYNSGGWLPGQAPENAGGLEVAFGTPTGAQMPLSQFDINDRRRPVFITHNATPYNGDASVTSSRNLHPTGVEFVDGAWRVVNLDGGEMTNTAFNVIAPLPGR